MTTANSNETKFYESFDFIITQEDAGRRIDAFLGSILSEYSRSYVQKLMEQGLVSVNEKVQPSKKYLLKEGDSVVIDIPEARPLDVIPEDIPIDIVYEDDDLMVVNKPQGMVVHPAAGNYTGTLVNAILFHCKSLSSINGVARPGIVHRIDKDTSGLLMIAKTNLAHQSLSEQLKDHSIDRIYYALVVGNVKKDEGFVEAPIARNPKDRMKMAIVYGGKYAKTRYRVIERLTGYTLVECTLETGRTHQIRVHMASLGNPLVGDGVYGGQNQKIKHNGQLLHAKTLGFTHPVTGERMIFESELPAYFSDLLDRIRKNK
jgi:23S rRNA pseudouridine1911/1915/1917 synthase